MPNKVTQEFRETVRQLLERNTDNVAAWLERVANGEKIEVPIEKADGSTVTKVLRIDPDPGKALDLLVKLAEFAAPKLARTEHVGEGGGPLKASVEVTFV